MNNLTIQQFCQLETLKTDINPLIASNCQYSEKIEGNLTVLKVTNPEGKVVQLGTWGPGDQGTRGQGDKETRR